ncbi:MAG: NAD(+)/NADH kinase [Clostridia bacterium]|nr:NAD(+)/NADH kinase [Clostridia bacterium]
MIVSVLPNLDKRGSAEMVDKLGAMLKELGIEAYITDNVCCSYYKNAPEDELFRISDIVITIGGDGTIIRFSKKAALYGKPILGINAGRMGYLADVEQKDYRSIARIFDGDYNIENRMMIKITLVENGKTVGEYEALNDAVISSGYISRIIDISAHIDNDVIRYRADGLIASTPTGSTAYSLSAGGPVIDPVMEAMCVVPICSHMLFAKPMIISGDKTLTLKAFSKKKSEIYLSVDGRKVANIKPYTEVKLTKSENKVKLIRLDNRSFFKTLSAKFSDIRGTNNEK